METPAPPEGHSTISPLLRVDDVAAIFGVTPTTIYRKVRKGEIPHIRLGRALRFNRATIERFLD